MSHLHLVSAQGTDAALWVNLTESVYTWSTENPYPAEDQTIIVQVEEQYIILVTVKECDISSEDGDFLLIKSGILSSKLKIPLANETFQEHPLMTVDREGCLFIILNHQENMWFILIPFSSASKCSDLMNKRKKESR